MTVLSIIQDAAVEVGVAVPTSIFPNDNVEVQELLRFANKEGGELVKRADWQILRAEQTFVSLAQESQTGMIPADLDHFIDETFWNRSRRLRLKGPFSAKDWQRLKATSTSPAVNCFTYRGGNILITPTPAAGQTLAFEYIKNTWCQSAALAPQTAWNDNADTGILSEALMTLGIIVRWKMSKGLPYDTDFADYETQVTLADGYDKPSVTASLAGGSSFYGFEAPEGDWPL